MKRKQKPYQTAPTAPAHGRRTTHGLPQYGSTAEDITREPEFREACRKAGVEPTKRQARKWRRREGQAWDAHDTTQRALAAQGA